MNCDLGLISLFVVISSDATTYAHFLFNAFDLDRNGSIRFEVRISLITSFFLSPSFFFIVFIVYSLWQDFVIGLSVLLRGSVTEKLNWAFNLYDINKDGYITKEVLVLMLQRLLHWHFCKADSNSNTFVCVGDAVNHEVNLRHDGQVHLPQCARWSSIWTCGKVLPGISNKHIYMKTQNQSYQSIKIFYTYYIFL